MTTYRVPVKIEFEVIVDVDDESRAADKAEHLVKNVFIPGMQNSSHVLPPFVSKSPKFISLDKSRIEEDE